MAKLFVKERGEKVLFAGRKKNEKAKAIQSAECEMH